MHVSTIPLRHREGFRPARSLGPKTADEWSDLRAGLERQQEEAQRALDWALAANQNAEHELRSIEASLLAALHSRHDDAPVVDADYIEFVGRRLEMSRVQASEMARFLCQRQSALSKLAPRVRLSTPRPRVRIVRCARARSSRRTRTVARCAAKTTSTGDPESEPSPRAPRCSAGGAR